MVRDSQMRRRCYSAELKKLGIAGILINFERDTTLEPGRSREAGTGKCGAAGNNYKKRVGV